MDIRRLLSTDWHTWRWALRLALLAIVFTLLTVFVADNFIVVETRLVFWSLEMRLAWSLLLTAVLGFSMGLLVARLRR